MARKVDQVLIVDGRGSLTTHLLIQKAPFILEASSVASDQNRFDAAYEAFRDLSEGLYDIDTRQVTSDDAPGYVERWPGEVTRIGSLVTQLAIGAIDDSAWWA